MSDQPVHIIVNPHAAHGKAAVKATGIIATLRESLPRVQLVETPSVDDARNYILALDHQPTTIIAVGGDGTINRVGNLLVDTPHTFGVIPAGTGNDFAKLLGLKNDKAILSAILDRKSHLLDTGIIRWHDSEGEHTHRFLNSIGIGFDAAVAGRMKHVSTGSGILPYLVNVFRELKHMKLARANLTVGSEHMERNLFLLAVGNGTSSGGGFKLTPHAKPDDGILDVCIVSDVRISRILRVLPETLWGGHLRHPEIEYAQAKTVGLTVPYGMPIHADGEVLTNSAHAIDIRVQPRSLKILLDNRIIETE